MISDEELTDQRSRHQPNNDSRDGDWCVECSYCDRVDFPCYKSRLLDALAEARQMAQAWEHAACARQTERDAAISDLGEWRNRFGDKS